MAMNETGQSSAVMEEIDEDPAVSMVDVLREEEELEADANAVLGDSDATNCTYLMGYVPRQALYACLTCNTSEPSGICLACSYECHDGHELVELYTKRNFKCDCGNAKFKDFKCKLFQNKADYNVDNRYNQNFKGLYCTCQRPYPDPDDDIEDEMILCVVCEDWYHGRHLGLKDVPDTNSDTEMVCNVCMSKHDFLWTYAVLSSEVHKITVDDSNSDVDIVRERTGKEETDKTDNADNVGEGTRKKKTNKKDVTGSVLTEQDNIHDQNVCSTSKDGNNQKKQCQLIELSKRKVIHEDSAVFFTNGWRRKLCTCTDCNKMYLDRNIEFLTDENDTVESYELRGKQKSTPSSQYDKGLQALSNMDRVQQVEVLHGFNDLKTELSNYLKKFAENKKVVREEDIKEFFTTMEARKRQRKSSSDGMTYFCK